MHEPGSCGACEELAVHGPGSCSAQPTNTPTFHTLPLLILPLPILSRCPHSVAVRARAWAESLPWGRLFELFFRLLGVFVFGPHMWLIGRHVRERWAEFVAKSEVYRTGDADVRQAMEQTHERECDEFLTERIQKEIHGSHAEPEVLELQAEMERKYWTVMLRPRPTEPQLRFIHRPDPKRSYAYPTYAAEDRPALQPSGELAA